MGRAGSPRPKKFKTQLSAGNVMFTVFWDAKGVFYVDIVPKRMTITGVYYTNLLDRLRAISVKNAEVNSPPVFCCNRTTRGSTLAQL